MKLTSSLLAVAVASCVACSCARVTSRELPGQIFVVTGGAENVRLGRVDVQLHDAAALRRAALEASEFATREADQLDKLETKALGVAEALRKDGSSSHAGDDLVDDLQRYRRAVRSAVPLFQRLPKTPVASARTDADGRFRLQVPRSGSYGVTATATRTITGTKEEMYFWAVYLRGDGELILSNDNMTTSAEAANNTVIRTSEVTPGLAAVATRTSVATLKAEADRLNAVLATPTPTAAPVVAAIKAQQQQAASVAATYAQPQPSLAPLMTKLTKPVQVQVGRKQETIAAGTALAVVSRGSGVVQVRYKGDSAFVPIDSTDLKK